MNPKHPEPAQHIFSPTMSWVDSLSSLSFNFVLLIKAGGEDVIMKATV